MPCLAVHPSVTIQSQFYQNS